MMNNINLQIDAAARQVSQNGKAVYLTQTEFDLLLYLLDNAGRITTRLRAVGAGLGYHRAHPHPNG